MFKDLFKKKLKAPWLEFYGGRKTSLKYPNVSMYMMLKHRATDFMDATAYDFMGTTATFKQFIAKIDRAARALADYGVKQGDAVTIVSANIPEAVIVIYAANKIGAVANVVHPLSSEADIKHALTLTGSKILFIMDMAYATAVEILPETKVKDVVVLSIKDSLHGLMKIGYSLTVGRKIGHIKKQPRVGSWGDFLGRASGVAHAVAAKTGGADPAAILYSGGTTGVPKGILVSNGAFNAHAVQSKEFASAELHPGNKVLGILPIFHGFGLSIGFHTMLCAGVTSVMLPKFDADGFHKILANKRPNIILGVPALFESMLSNPKIAKLDLSFIQMVICGGDKIQDSLKTECDRLLHSRGCDVEIMQGYGLTEYLAVASFGPQERVKMGSIGIPLADVYLKIVEPETDIEKLVGEMGEIVIHGPSMMDGYINSDEETNRALMKHSDGRVWLHTGDLGHMDEEGYFFFDQRLKRLIISSGYNVYPNHIESVIGEMEEVLIATVIGVPDKQRGQKAKAFVVLKTGVEPSGALKKQIMEHCKKNLPKFSLPWEIEFRESLPKTKLGKIAYTELK
jgi:long-chain acyl-CoA synthetase